MPVDIMVPYWGSVDLLRELVESVRGQTSPDWRLTIVDDAYPGDAARHYVEGIGDDRIVYLRNETNLGISRSFQRAAQLSTSDIVVVPGCDDVFLPRYVEVIEAAFERFPGVEVVQPGVRVIDDESRPSNELADRVKRRLTPRTATGVVLSGERLATGLMHGDWLYWPSLAFHGPSLRAARFREDLAVIQDLGLVIDMTCAGARLLVIPDEVFLYRRHATSASSAVIADGTRFEGEREYFESARGQLLDQGWRRAAFAARLRITSRLHAAATLPRALLGRQFGAARTLARHAFGP